MKRILNVTLLMVIVITLIGCRATNGTTAVKKQTTVHSGFVESENYESSDNKSDASDTATQEHSPTAAKQKTVAKSKVKTATQSIVIVVLLLGAVLFEGLMNSIL